MSEVNVFGATTMDNNELPITTFSINEPICLDCYNYFKDQIAEFVELPNNWDGYHGIPLIKNIADIASKFVAMLDGSYLDLVTDIFPNPNGTITFEWEKADEEKLSLELGETNYSYFVKYSNKEPKLVNGEDILHDIKTLTKSISELFGEPAVCYIFE